MKTKIKRLFSEFIKQCLYPEDGCNPGSHSYKVVTKTPRGNKKTDKIIPTGSRRLIVTTETRRFCLSFRFFLITMALGVSGRTARVRILRYCSTDTARVVTQGTTFGTANIFPSSLLLNSNVTSILSTVSARKLMCFTHQIVRVVTFHVGA